MTVWASILKRIPDFDQDNILCTLALSTLLTTQFLLMYATCENCKRWLLLRTRLCRHECPLGLWPKRPSMHLAWQISNIDDNNGYTLYTTLIIVTRFQSGDCLADWGSIWRSGRLHQRKGSYCSTQSCALFVSEATQWPNSS
jgi:hypothetical protein